MTKVTCAFAEARISKENSVLTVMVYKCLFREGLQQDKLGLLTPVQLSVGEQRGGFSGFAHAADPVQISLRMLREKDACPDFDTY